MSTSRSPSRSRPRPYPSRSITSDSHLQTPPALSAPEGILVDGPVDPVAVNLLKTLKPPILPGALSRTSSSSRVRTGNEIYDENDRWTGNGLFAEEDEDDGIEYMPWWKIPSPIWLLVGTFLAAIAIGMTIAPRIEIYMKLVCRELRPEYDLPTQPLLIGSKFQANTIVPRPSPQCQADSLVQQTVAKFGALITAIIGVLSSITAGHWGQFGDRRGRTTILAITMLGGIFTESMLIFVSFFQDKLPFGYRTLIIAPIIEGLCGGIATGSAATHAYICDTTTPLTRSRMLALSMGLLFVGMAVGPTFGGLLITYTNNLLSVFYVAWSLHILYLFSMLFIIPESLTQANMQIMRERHEKEKAERKAANGGRIEWWRELTLFVRPLNVLLPKNRSIEGTRRRDWNLTVLAIAYGSVIMVMGSYPYKFQYAAFTFHWTSEELGYWLSLIGVTRSTYLIIILPLVIKFLITFTSLGPPPPSTPNSNSSKETHHQTSRLDLFIARGSLLLELGSYAFIVLWPTNDYRVFSGAALISSLSGGFSPSVQALSLEIVRVWDEEDQEAENQSEERNGEPNMNGNSERTPLLASTSSTYKPSLTRSSSIATTITSSEPASTAVHHPRTPTAPAGSGNQANNRTGTVFGALSVIQALCSQIIGPPLYSLVFVKGIDWNYPRAIFGLSCVFVLIGIGCLSTIRVGGKGRAGTNTERV